MWEPIAKDVALPWQRVESMYLQLQRERRITSEKTNGGLTAKSHEIFSRKGATLPQRSPPSRSVRKDTLTGKIERTQHRPGSRRKLRRSEFGGDEYHTADDMPRKIYHCHNTTLERIYVHGVTTIT